MGLNKFANLPFLILVLFIGTSLFGDSLGYAAKSQLYAISLCMKDLIVFILPVIIFSLVMSGIMNLKNESLKVIITLFALVCFSNFAGFWMSYIFTAPILDSGIITISRLNQDGSLLPAWHIQIEKIVSNDAALLSGLIVGIFGNFIKSGALEVASRKLLTVTNFLLKKVICSVLPLFILGFIVKMQHDGALTLIIKEYSRLLLVVVLLTYGYMLTIMYFVSGRSFSSTFAKFKNLLPGILVGFFSMSSAAAIPTTIECCKKNLKDEEMANFIVPTTANMHLLGDCFALPIIGLALMMSFGYGLPTLGKYLVFTLYGVVAKFAAAGIPGGSAIIFAPLFEAVFGFSGEMLSAVTAIYVLFDPFATSANVFGHGVLASVFEKISRPAASKKSSSDPIH
jgi:Na+/H+-dicarboxylate symporter